MNILDQMIDFQRYIGKVAAELLQCFLFFLFQFRCVCFGMFRFHRSNNPVWLLVLSHRSLGKAKFAAIIPSPFARLLERLAAVCQFMEGAGTTTPQKIAQHLRVISTWAILLEAIDRTQGDDISIPNHALGEVGRSIVRESTAAQELLDELEPRTN